MTREEAIKLFRRDIECLSHDKCSECILEEACDPMKTPLDSEYIEAYGIAIKALSAEPCEDAISRAAVIDILRYECSDKVERYLRDKIEALPSVTPKQKMCRWIWQTEDIYRCSECNEDVHVKEVMNVPQYEFCPNCGARMKGDIE